MAWGLSLIVHLGAAGILLWSAYGIREHPDDLEQLVFVEPAPLPPPAPEEVAKKAGLIHPEHPVAEEGLALPYTPQPTVTMRRQPTAQPTRPRPTRTPARAPAPPDAPQAAEVSQPRPQEPGSGRGRASGGAAGGVAGGVEGGRAGGVVGGMGNEIVDAETAARPPVLVDRALPEYPVEARVKRIEGQVLLRAIVGRDGKVEPSVEVLRSVPELDEAAIAALRQWRFTPGQDRDGNPVRVRIDVPMRFQLKP